MRLLMMGTGTFAEPTFEAILAGPEPVVALATQPDRDAGRVGGSTRQTGRGMKAIAEAHGVPVIQPDSINTPESVEALRRFEADLFVVAAYGQILSREVLAVPRLGSINVHGSLLPKYRGAAPIAWAIYNGERETGVTILRITPSLDAGEMLAKGSTPIGAGETAGEVEARLAVIGARLATEVIGRMREGPVSGEQQDQSAVTRAPKLRKEHGAIDWSRPAEAVCRQVSAMQPWPSAYTYWHQAGSSKPPVRLQVIRAAPIADVNGEPGVVLDPRDGPRLWVATNPGAVEIFELQPAGKKRMTAEVFLRGHRVAPGDRFGPEVKS